MEAIPRADPATQKRSNQCLFDLVAECPSLHWDGNLLLSDMAQYSKCNSLFTDTTTTALRLLEELKAC
jgi:hypothetical protein